jgi:hypothetical protein
MTLATWNEQLDKILVQMIDERRRRWKIISGLLGTVPKMKKGVIFLKLAEK